MICSCKNLFYLIVILQVCLTWVAAQGDLNVTSPAETLNATLAENEAPTPTDMQNDQETHPKVAEEPQAMPPTPAATEEHEETEQPPTRQPNLQSTTPPPIIRRDGSATAGEHKNETKGTTPGRADPTKKTDGGGHAGISVANFALVLLGVSTLLIY